MPATWVVPQLGTDFPDDFEDVIIQYVYDKWNISNPAKGSTLKPDYTIQPDTVSFKPGFPDLNRPYEVCCIQTITMPIEKINGKWTFTTGLEFLIRMKRIERAAIEVDPQLENMEGEIQRIVESYVPNEIPGYMDLVYDKPATKRMYGPKASWAKSDWLTIIKIKVFYQKDDLT